MSRAAAPPAVRQFYASVVDEASLVEAREVEGIDEELALLRVRLRTLIEERPQDYALMLRGVALIAKAVSARYRMSAKSKADLASSLAAVLEQVGAQFYPERSDDG